MIALISPDETIDYTMPDQSTIVCWRVAQTAESQYEFPVAEPLFWTPCDDTIIANEFVYNPETQGFLELPKPAVPNGEQPITSGGIETL